LHVNKTKTGTVPGTIPSINSIWSRGLYIGKYPPPPGGGGGNKYGLMGKKYHENNASADKKGEKERKDKGKEKIRQSKNNVSKIMGNLEKNAGNRGHNNIFFPLLF
jgi:hypothetical protein